MWLELFSWYYGFIVYGKTYLLRYMGNCLWHVSGVLEIGMPLILMVIGFGMWVALAMVSILPTNIPYNISNNNR